METYTLNDLIRYSDLDSLDIEEIAEDTYEIRVPYEDTYELSLISSFVSDLTNNNFVVNSSFKDSIALIKVFKNQVKTSSKEINTSAAYYMIKRWVDKLNRQLQDLSVEVEKVSGDYDYGTKRQVKSRYAKGSTFYILNPEINQQELIDIVEFLDAYNVELRPSWFRRANIYSVAENPFLKSLGYSDNETYLAFPIDKDPINFNPYENLGEGNPNRWKETIIDEQ